MFGNVCGTGCQYQAGAWAGLGRGWPGPGLGGEAMGSSERNNDNYSFLGAAAGLRGHRSLGRAVIKESNDLLSAVLIFFP